MLAEPVRGGAFSFPSAAGGADLGKAAEEEDEEEEEDALAARGDEGDSG